MLPPVHAALSSNADYQSNLQPTALRAPIRAAANSEGPDARDLPLTSGGRQDALSLSAQLRLAQGSSILAETIGRLLDIPRKENETLVDYTTRLFEAVQALKPSEQAAVERLLNQIVKGISLRLMAEILKNPSGPDAARLASYIEAASNAESDLAAKAVVSSYRQNGSADVQANRNLPRPVQGGTASGQSPSTITPPASSAITVGEDVSVTPAPVTPSTDEQSDADGTGRGRLPTADGQANSSTRTGSPALPAQTAASSSSAAAGIQTINMAALTGTGGKETGKTTNAAEAAANTPSGDSDDARAPSSTDGKTMAARTEASAGRLYDGPALARRSLEAFRQDAAQAIRAAINQAKPDAAAVLAAALAETGLPEQAHPEARVSALPQAERRDDATGKTIQQDLENNSKGPLARSASDGDETQPQFRAADSARAATGTLPSAAALERPDGALPGMLPIVPREGVPLPQVPYPPGEQEPHREERKTREISAISDEDDDAPPQGHDFHQDQQEEPEGESEQGEGPEEAADTASGDQHGRPNDLYWRMAGWS